MAGTTPPTGSGVHSPTAPPPGGTAGGGGVSNPKAPKQQRIKAPGDGPFKKIFNGGLGVFQGIVGLEILVAALSSIIWNNKSGGMFGNMIGELVKRQVKDGVALARKIPGEQTVERVLVQKPLEWLTGAPSTLFGATSAHAATLKPGEQPGQAQGTQQRTQGAPLTWDASTGSWTQTGTAQAATTTTTQQGTGQPSAASGQPSSIPGVRRGQDMQQLRRDSAPRIQSPASTAPAGTTTTPPAAQQTTVIRPSAPVQQGP